MRRIIRFVRMTFLIAKLNHPGCLYWCVQREVSLSGKVTYLGVSRQGRHRVGGEGELHQKEMVDRLRRTILRPGCMFPIYPRLRNLVRSMFLRVPIKLVNAICNAGSKGGNVVCPVREHTA